MSTTSEVLIFLTPEVLVLAIASLIQLEINVSLSANGYQLFAEPMRGSINYILGPVLLHTVTYSYFCRNA